MMDLITEIENMQDSIFLKGEKLDGERMIHLANLKLQRTGMFGSHPKELVEPMKDVIVAMIARMLNKHCGQKEFSYLQLSLINGVRRGHKMIPNPSLSSEELVIIQQELFNGYTTDGQPT